MEAVADATLAKWGNSRGVRIPKNVCSLLGIDIGAKASVTVDTAANAMTLTFDKPQPKYHRSRKLSIEELCEGWEGERVGEEWGGADVGGEVVL